jgi:RNA polymerase sigma-70 factor, ECF subfamily
MNPPRREAAARLLVESPGSRTLGSPSGKPTSTDLFLVPSTMTDPSDRERLPEEIDAIELMARVRVGDVGAFEQVVERYWRRTFLYAQHLVHDRDRAYDITQEAFSRLWLKRESWKPGSVGAWLLRTARNQVITEQRKWQVRLRWSVSARREEVKRPRTPLEEVEGEELRLAMTRAIEDLSPRRREVFVLFHLQNLSYREIAEVLDIRPQTVANYLQAAVAQLRVSLAAFFPALSSGADRSPPNERDRPE